MRGESTAKFGVDVGSELLDEYPLQLHIDHIVPWILLEGQMVIYWHGLGSSLHLGLCTELLGDVWTWELFVGWWVSRDGGGLCCYWLRDFLKGIHAKLLKVQYCDALLLLLIIHHRFPDLLPKWIYFQNYLSLVDFVCAEIKATSKITNSLRFLLDAELAVDSFDQRILKSLEFILLFLIFLAKLSPSWFQLRFETNIFTCWVYKEQLFRLVFASLEFAPYVLVVLNEQRPLDEVEDPARKAVWRLHVHPQRSFTIKIRVVRFLDPLDVMWSYQVVAADDNLGHLVEFSWVFHEFLANSKSIMQIKSVCKSNVREQVFFGC